MMSDSKPKRIFLESKNLDDFDPELDNFEDFNLPEFLIDPGSYKSKREKLYFESKSDSLLASSENIKERQSKDIDFCILNYVNHDDKIKLSDGIFTIKIELIKID